MGILVDVINYPPYWCSGIRPALLNVNKNMSKLSLYADSLPPDAKARYLDRIESIGSSVLV